MGEQEEAFFSWTARRVVLAPLDAEVPDRCVLDVRMMLGDRDARLITRVDPTDDLDYTALFVGRVAGTHDVPIRVVEDETLLLVGSHSSSPAEILVCAGDVPDLGGHLTASQVDRDLHRGGPVSELVRMSRAASVLLDWCDSPQAMAEPSRGMEPSGSRHSPGIVRTLRCGLRRKPRTRVVLNQRG